MSFTNDVTTTIGKVRLYAGDADSDTHIFDDDQVTVFISDSAGIILLAAYKLVLAKIALLAALPASQSMSSYSQSMDLGALKSLSELLKKNLEEFGYSVDGNDVAQWGHAEVARTLATWRKSEANKAARGESW